MSDSGKTQARLASGVTIALLAAVVGWPALATVLASARGAAEPARSGLLTPLAPGFGSLEVPRQMRLAGETIRLVVATEAIALPIGLALALLLFRTDAWGRNGILVLLAVSAFVPLPLHATAWLGAFGNAGRAQLFGLSPFLVGWSGAAFVHAMAALPWVVFLAGVGVGSVEAELEESASLDLPAWRVACRVTLRRSLGGISAAALAVAVMTAGDMTVTDRLLVRTYAEEAYLQFNLGKGAAAAGAVVLPPLLVLGSLVLLAARALLKADPARLASFSTRVRPWRLGRWRRSIGGSIGVLVGGLMGIPLVSLVWHAGRVGGSARIGQPPHWTLGGLLGTLRFAWGDAFEPLVTSAILGALGATFAVVLAWSLAWSSRKPGLWRWITAGAVALALAAPGPVVGMALVIAYRPLMFLYDSPAMNVLADIARTFPYALLVLWPAVRSIPPELLDAAAVDGLGPWALIWRVALASARSATIAAWFVAFALALGELPATNLVTPPGLDPLSVGIWIMLHSGVESRLAGIVLIMLAAVATAGLAAVWALRRVNRVAG